MRVGKVMSMVINGDKDTCTGSCNIMDIIRLFPLFFGMIFGNLVIYRSMVGARLGHGWGKNLDDLGQGWSMVRAQGMLGA